MTLPELFCVPLERDIVTLTGRDRLSFLQGMVTNDVAGLQPGQGCYAFHLTSKGQILTDCRIACREDSIWIDTEPGWGTILAESLEHHLVMERVKIASAPATPAYLYGGTALEKAFAVVSDTLPPGEGSNRVRGDGFLMRAQWISGHCYLAYAIEIHHDDCLVLSFEVLEGLRIEAGVPRGQIDFDSKTLAPETGQDARAIHYKKGCYLGQEVVARLDARGHTNRGLVGLRTEKLVAPGAAITVDGEAVGWVTSAAVGPTLGVPLALGYLRHAHAAPGTRVTVGGVATTVAALPFVGDVSP